MFPNNYERYSARARGSQFMNQVFGLMSFALALSGCAAYYVAHSARMMELLISSPSLAIFLFIAQIGLVVIINAYIMRLSMFAAVSMLMAYALLVGVTLSSLFLVYEVGSLYTTFAATAGMFGCMALYGYFTKSDLTSYGSLGFMGLIGIIIASVVNMFVQSEQFNIIISGAGVLIFTLLTAYDVQKLKQIAYELAADHEDSNKIAVLGALTLYLDFINLFLFLLQFMGRRRQS